MRDDLLSEDLQTHTNMSFLDFWDDFPQKQRALGDGYETNNL
jgi:hypothetical protein